MEEIWKPVKDYENLYEVSNFGRVRNIAHGTIENQQTISEGYKHVALKKDGRRKMFGVHRLVALAFCDGYKPGLIVNHKNEIKDDNRAENLEFCTKSYNTTYHDAQLKGREKAVTRPCCNKKRKRLGKQLHEVRKAKGLKVSYVANLAHTSEQTIYRMEKGVYTYSFDMLESVVNVYGLTMDLVEKKSTLAFCAVNKWQTLKKAIRTVQLFLAKRCFCFLRFV